MADKKRKSEGELYSIFVKKPKPTAEDSVAGSPAKVDDDPSADTRLLSLQSLLDFSLVTTEDEISTRFDQIAKALIHEFRLVVRRENARDVEFEILEAEFYLQVGGCHEDPFTHGSEEQKVGGRWYFHRAPRFSKDSHRSLTSTTEYRGGSRKGMDLTFGGPLQSTEPLSEGTSTLAGRLLRGGILLRSVRQTATGKVVSGPSLLVDQILSASGVSSIEDLVENKWEKNTSAFHSDASNHTTCMFLKPVPSTTTQKRPPTIYFSPRIGLDLSHPGTTSPTTLPLHPRIRFLPRRYRFFVHPEWLVANGRPQTFLGVLQSCISSYPSHADGLKKASLSREIARITGTKESTSAKYLADYIAGRTAGVGLLESFIGTKGKGASSSVSTYLKMMGALSNLPP
ncbi:hypothetical protein BDZ97DRAFT_1916773 [Flammula alnicola]|nr:hypothetical protein BDZ97DRAFT_1916773 [Flammula alnicola]